MKRIFISAIALTISVLSFAFSGSGAGTEKSPYLITSADELFEVRSNLSAYYRLENDIDLSAWLEENSPIYGWAPIGTSTSPFYGRFDGNGKKILNLIINREQSDGVGLFGYATSSGLFTNITIINPLIVGRNCVGTIIGDCDLVTTISGCRVIGGYIKGENHVGGVVGRFYSDVAAVSSLKGAIEKCMVSSEIEGIEFVGGICGYTHGEGQREIHIEDCCSNGSVCGTNKVGGILGYDDSCHLTFPQGYGTATYYPTCVCERNYIRGNVCGESNTNGIVGGEGEGAVNYRISSNVCLADTIKGTYSLHYSWSS